MSDFIWNIAQDARISSAATDAGEAKDEVRRHRDRIQELEFTVNRMSLVCQALWELLRSRLGITEAELLGKIREVDLRDGVEDQRMTPTVTTCPKCGQPLNTKASRCIYCGVAVAKPHVFQ
jgi:uncharacterized protein with PIN domain